jgi:hypothetical protein
MKVTPQKQPPNQKPLSIERKDNRGDRHTGRAALQRMRERAEQRKFGRFDWDEWKAFRDDGRQ